MSPLRIWHTYIGLFIAPSVLFFTCTGALQLFSLHEAHGSYAPLPVVEKLGMLHKDQVFARKPRHPEPAGPEASASAHEDHPESGGEEDSPEVTQLLTKCFFLLVALGLATSTILGIWMGLTQIRRKRVGQMLLVVGTVVPVLFALL